MKYGDNGDNILISVSRLGSVTSLERFETVGGVWCYRLIFSILSFFLLQAHFFKILGLVVFGRPTKLTYKEINSNIRKSMLAHLESA